MRVTAQDPSELLTMMRLIATGDAAGALRVLAAAPGLATASIETGATRQNPGGSFLEAIGRYVYAGHTALHVAAGAYQDEVVRTLIGLGADVRARNRRGAEPLHEAAVGDPGSAYWNLDAQVAVVVRLIAAGADPNAIDKDGATPLHRAVRTRCAAAVAALLEGGADPHRKNKSGSTALRLAAVTSGRGGTGSPESKAQQTEIIRLLEPA
jgi:hypothetical protein